MSACAATGTKKDKVARATQQVPYRKECLHCNRFCQSRSPTRKRLGQGHPHGCLPCVLLSRCDIYPAVRGWENDDQPGDTMGYPIFRHTYVNQGKDDIDEPLGEPFKYLK